MAAPYVTGAAALLKTHNGALTAAQIRTRLLETGDSLTDLQGRTVTGRRLNVHQALINTATEPLPGPELRVDVTTGRSYRAGQTASIRVRVRDPITGHAVPGANVEAVVQTPNGGIYTAEGITSATGYVTFKFKRLRTDGRGTYLVTVEAARAGYELGTDSTTFRGR